MQRKQLYPPIFRRWLNDKIIESATTLRENQLDRDKGMFDCGWEAGKIEAFKEVLSYSGGKD